MRRIWIFLSFVALGAAQHPELRQFGRLPLVFESNQGQVDPSVKFLARVEGGALFLTEREAVLAARGGGVVRMRLAGAGKPQAIQALEPTGGVSNYILRNDPARWRTGIPHFLRVAYRSVCTGVDIVYYGNPQSLEYDLIVSPGADPAEIQMAFDGVKSMRLDRAGDLVLKTSGGELRQKRPRAFQETASGRVEVQARYRLKPGKRVGFELARYDAGRPLIIDPVLSYSTYLGGSGADLGNAIAVDGLGNVYVTGQTTTNFPTTNPFQADNGGGVDVFVTKVNAAGSARVYSTYLGGAGDDFGYGIAVDSAGNAYVTGYTKSANFPTTASPIQGTHGGGTGDAFVTKLNASGTALLYSTYLGGSGDDVGHGIAVDSSGNAYVAGDTGSANFPTTNPLQPNNGGGVDGFVTKINAAGSARVYSTYLGGALTDAVFGIAVDGSGNAYLTGTTGSTDFPTKNPIQMNNGGADDVFVTKINTAGSALVYSTYLGGLGFDRGNAIAVDGAGNAYVTGQTNSTDFPTTSPLQPNNGGAIDAFVTKINAAGSGRVYSTYLGGNDIDYGNGIAVDIAGNAFVAGYTTSTTFPTTNPIQANKGATGPDGFVTQINAAGSAPVYSTYLGGDSADQANGIATDSLGGNVYVTGITSSTTFPGVNAHSLQPIYGTGSSDAFVSLISSSPTVTSLNPVVSTGASQAFTFQLSDPEGYQDLGVINVLINNFLDGRQACYIAYSRPLNVVYLVNDAGDALLAPLLLNGSGSVSNSQCTITGAGSSATGNGNTLTLILNITFSAGFGGNKVVYVAARDSVEHNSGWQTMGVHGVPPLPAAFPKPIGLNPSSGTSADTTVTFTFQDASAATNLQTAWALINTAIDGRSACSIAYYRPGNQVYLYPDNGDGSQATSMVLTGTNTVSNSQCTILSQGSSVAVNGAQLSVALHITFKPAFSGPKGVWLAVQTLGGAQTSPWESLGAWQVPGN